MTDHPRRTPPTQTERVRVVTTRTAPGSMLGGTRMAKPVTRAALGVLRAAGLFALIFHEDDPTVGRPSVLFAYWVGAATPANAEPFDWWFDADV